MAVSHSQAPGPFLLVGVLTIPSPRPEYDVSLRDTAQPLLSMTSGK